MQDMGVMRSLPPHEACFSLSGKMKPIEKQRKNALCSDSVLDVHRPNRYDYYELAWGEFPV